MGMQDLISSIMGGMNVPDSKQLGEIRGSTKSSRENIQRQLTESKDEIAGLRQRAKAVSDTFDAQTISDLRDYSAVRIMHDLVTVVNRGLVKNLDNLERLSSASQSLDKLELPDMDDDANNPFSRGMKMSQVRILRESAEACSELAKYNSDLILDGIVKFAPALKAMTQAATNYHKYLAKKFLNVGEEFSNRVQKYPWEDDDDQGADVSGVRYVKMELLEDNPLLTDIALSISDRLPRMHKRKRTVSVKTKKDGKMRKKTVAKKELDEVDVDSVAHALVDLANPAILRYIRQPQQFVEQVNGLITDYHKIVSAQEPNFRQMQKSMEEIGFVKIASDEARDFIERPMANPAKYTMRLRSLNYLSILPTPEEVRPDNLKEKKVSAARKILLEHIVSTLDQIQKERNDDQKLELARIGVRKAVSLKDRMYQAGQTDTSRRLERDKDSDKEFYVGTTEGHGEFKFVREAAPDVKMSDVVGKSFDGFKAHLQDLNQYTKFSQLYKQTSPRGKVKTNIIAIGPYGCGKTEIGRAIASDKNVIAAEVNISQMMTCWFGEFEANVGRVWDQARELRRNSGDSKLVFLLMDEFDSWFSDSDSNSHDSTFQRVQKALQIKLDGVVDYDGVVVVGFTNQPKKIPIDIYRRFNYIDVVGQLDQAERAHLLEKFLKKGLPISPQVTQEHYNEWAKRLDDAPGDVIGKVADAIHYQFMRKYVGENTAEGRKLNSYLARCGINDEAPSMAYVKKMLGSSLVIDGNWINGVIDVKMNEPAIIEQIKAARKVYSEADQVLSGIHSKDGKVSRDFPGFAQGMRH